MADLYRRTFEEEAAALGAKAEVNVELAYRAVRLAEDEPVVNLARRALKALGLDPKLRLICGGTDASILNTRDIRYAVLGMGARAPHTPDEHIRVADLEFAAKLVKTLLEIACWD